MSLFIISLFQCDSEGEDDKVCTHFQVLYKKKNNWFILITLIFLLQGSDAESVLFESSTSPPLARKCK